MKSPKDLLDEIVDMIDGDLDSMRADNVDKLDVRSAAKITRYSKALLEILGYESDQRKEQKKKLASLTDEELKELAKKALKD